MPSFKLKKYINRRMEAHIAHKKYKKYNKIYLKKRESEAIVLKEIKDNGIPLKFNELNELVEDYIYDRYEDQLLKKYYNYKREADFYYNKLNKLK